MTDKKLADYKLELLHWAWTADTWFSYLGLYDTEEAQKGTALFNINYANQCQNFVSGTLSGTKSLNFYP